MRAMRYVISFKRASNMPVDGINFDAINLHQSLDGQLDIARWKLVETQGRVGFQS